MSWFQLFLWTLKKSRTVIARGLKNDWPLIQEFSDDKRCRNEVIFSCRNSCVHRNTSKTLQFVYHVRRKPVVFYVNVYPMIKPIDWVYNHLLVELHCISELLKPTWFIGYGSSTTWVIGDSERTYMNQFSTNYE